MNFSSDSDDYGNGYAYALDTIVPLVKAELERQGINIETSFAEEFINGILDGITDC